MLLTTINLWIALNQAVISGVYGAPFKLLDKEISADAPAKPETDLDTVKFLQNFGYLKGGVLGSSSNLAVDAASLYTESSISSAIREMQLFAGIQETGVIDNATIQLMQSPRCGLPDTTANKTRLARSTWRQTAIGKNRSKRYIIGGQGWNKRDLTYFISNWTPKLGPQVIDIELEKAFKLWSDYSRLNFRRTSNSEADIVISFGRGYHGDNYPFDGPGNILAHAFYPYEMDSNGGDIHFDDDEDWIQRKSTSQEGLDFFTVATHEIGHSLGLSHSPVGGSVMFPYYKGMSTDSRLHYDDILGMYQLYISRPIKDQNTEEDRRESGSDERKDENGNEDDHQSDESGDEGDDRVGNAPEDPSKEADRRDKPKPMPTTQAPSPKTTQSSSKSPTTELFERKPTPTSTASDGGSDNHHYHGDFETVDEHLEHDHHHRPHQYTTENGMPSLCEGNFDAIAELRGELFIFKKKHMWRYSSRRKLVPGYPAPFRQMFPELPEWIKSIDAVYERPDSNIVLFTGRSYWIHDGQRLVENSPREITEFGFPEEIMEIDAAMVWGKNGKTYLFSRNLYWRLNETTGKIDPGYPDDMRRWPGIPRDLDAATEWKDGSTYFFQGSNFWKFNNENMKAESGYPRAISSYWTECS